jgi:hypothetical protein
MPDISDNIQGWMDWSQYHSVGPAADADFLFAVQVKIFGSMKFRLQEQMEAQRTKC